MRVFIAIDLPEGIRHRLSDIQKHLKPSTRTARWVAPESIHITLKFIGEVAAGRITEIDQALAGLAWKQFLVTVRGLGFFPGSRSPRVLWAGLHVTSMEGLAKEIDARLERIGIDRETREFRAHVTLARAAEKRLDEALVRAVTTVQDQEFGSFTVDRFVLYQSVTKPTGSVYTRLKEYPLS